MFQVFLSDILRTYIKAVFLSNQLHVLGWIDKKRRITLLSSVLLVWDNRLATDLHLTSGKDSQSQLIILKSADELVLYHKVHRKTTKSPHTVRMKAF